MRKVGADIGRLLADLGADSDAARVNMRTRQVLDRYRRAIQMAYPPRTADYHLAHTNRVIIQDVSAVGKNGQQLKVRTLTVFVEDSMCASDLNAQRELIRLFLLEEFGEEIEDFQIKVSGNREYKSEHPYLHDDAPKPAAPAVPLDADERAYVVRTVAMVEDEKLRKSLEKAMTADLEWKKGENVESKRENAK